ncbi:hypothetical protein C7T94_07765 [Pedobacter yulinensis]|uniref:3-keto-disaccharide hydrolase domain-containing protein n=1 Tax=Pedobacter yulinensis TaxID=2126353 RepID=A0A2T3HJF7_9SPHI|nr:hypothetical protein [Pedobacter yulinensis]PST82559.1 hypothetical protein C7T94_07765 [Pedobacter yulinensis]
MKNKFKTTLILFTALLALGACKKKDPAPDEEGLMLNEEFKNASDPFIRPNSYAKIQDGQLVMTYEAADVAIVDIVANKDAFSGTDARQTVEASFQHTEGHAYDQASLYFAIDASQNFYAFSVGDKEFRIHARRNGQAQNIIGWTASAAIKGQINEVNRLRISLAEEKLQFYINGTLVANVSAPGWKTLDKLGIGMGKLGSAPRTVYKVDYIKCWNK